MDCVKNFKRTYILLCLIFVLSGICMIIYPVLFAYAICYVLGGICVLYGIMRLVGYFSKDLYKIAFQFDLALGIASVILGCALIFCSKEILSFIPLIIGVFTLISAALKIQSAFDAKKFGLKKWWVLLVFSLLTLGLGLFLIVCPFKSMALLIVMLGITLMTDGIQSLFLILYTVKYK